MNLTAMLAGEADPEGIRSVVSGRTSRKALRHELESLLADGHRITACRLRRVKFKPGRKLTANYDVQIGDREGRTTGTHPVAVTWSESDARTAPATAASAQIGVDKRAEALPFRRLEKREPRSGMRIRVSPFDECFPELALWAEPAYVTQAIGDEESPHQTMKSIRYRPGQRHVLAYAPGHEGRAASKRDAIFVKISNANVEGRPFHAAIAVSRWLDGDGGRATGVRPLVHSGSAILYQRVPGRPLSRCLSDEGRAVAGRLNVAGLLLRRLHAMPIEDIRGLHLASHNFAAELAATARAAEHVQAFSSALADRIRRVVETAQDLHDCLPQGGSGFVHGDFKADHLWLSRRGMTLIDFDSSRIGDQALDVGKLLADLIWWYQGKPSSVVSAAQDAFLDAYAQGQRRELLAGARLYEAVFLVKAAVRRVPVIDPGWESRTERLVERAELTLAASKGLRRSSGIRGHRVVP
jgi:Ser/Thr protein kinase RdoA (MazF antagonist)